MLIRFQREVEDIVAFSDHYLARSRFVKRAVARYRLFGALAIGGITLLVTYALMPTVAVFGTIVALIAALGFASQAGNIVKRSRQQAIRKLYTENKNSPVLGQMELEVLEAGVVTRTATTETRIAWSAIQDIVSTQNHTFIHLSPIRAYIIPHKKVVEGSLPALLAEIGRLYHPGHTLPPGTL